MHFNLLVFVCNKIMMTLLMMMVIAQWKGIDVKIIRNLLATGLTYFGFRFLRYKLCCCHTLAGLVFRWTITGC